MSKIINESIFIKTLKPNINTIKIKKKIYKLLTRYPKKFDINRLKQKKNRKMVLKLLSEYPKELSHNEK